MLLNCNSKNLEKSCTQECFPDIFWNSEKHLYFRTLKIRNSHRRFSVKKGVPRNFAQFTGKHLCESLYFNKVAGLRPATLLK